MCAVIVLFLFSTAIFYVNQFENNQTQTHHADAI